MQRIRLPIPCALLTDLGGKGDAASCGLGRGQRLSRGRDDALRRKLFANKWGVQNHEIWTTQERDTRSEQVVCMPYHATYGKAQLQLKVVEMIRSECVVQSSYLVVHVK